MKRSTAIWAKGSTVVEPLTTISDPLAAPAIPSAASAAAKTKTFIFFFIFRSSLDFLFHERGYRKAVTEG